MAGSKLHRMVRDLIAGLEGDLDWIRDAIPGDEQVPHKVRVLAYAGYRNDKLARLKGRIVRYARPLDAREGTLVRLRAMLDIYNSHELPGVEVRLEAYGGTFTAVSDE